MPKCEKFENFCIPLLWNNNSYVVFSCKNKRHSCKSKNLESCVIRGDKSYSWGDERTHRVPMISHSTQTASV